MKKRRIFFFFYTFFSLSLSAQRVRYLWISVIDNVRLRRVCAHTTICRNQLFFFFFSRLYTLKKYSRPVCTTKIPSTIILSYHKKHDVVMPGVFSLIVFILFVRLPTRIEKRSTLVVCPLVEVNIVKLTGGQSVFKK